MKAKYRIETILDIAKVCADFPVQFCLLTKNDHQYVAYYDDAKRMTIAMRKLDATDWTYKSLPSVVGWDSHNYVTMALDEDDHLHVSGNMHCDALVYFCTTTVGDISTLAPMQMTGVLENRVTYPRFLADRNGRLVFNYRHGGSGNGTHVYNRYDCKSRQWSRLLDTPLLDGQNQMSAYPTRPTQGPDGLFHMLWVWRDSPDCATNHHLSYARSPDLIHWESAFGRSVEIPITLRDECLWVDPIPTGGGILNGCAQLRFDTQSRPVITYHKSDEAGHMQVYAARPEGAAWASHCLTTWNTQIDFGGEGSMGFIGIHIGALELFRPGIFTISYHHQTFGRGHLFVDEDTLCPLDCNEAIPPEYPPALAQIESDFDGVEIQRAFDTGGRCDAGDQYMLQWETLPRNRDKPRVPPLPEPSTLRLYKLLISPCSTNDENIRVL